jgi:hypothetical protein
MTRLFAVLPAAIAALVAANATPAAAQLAGTYSGTSLNGDYVSFTVATDTGTGKLAVMSANISFSALCGNGSTLNTAWGYGMTQDIVKHRVKNITAGPYFTITFNLDFAAGGQSATGQVTSISPTLTPVGPAPKHALFCRSPSQTMSVTYQGAAAKFTPPANGAVMLGKLQTVQP